MTAIFISHSSRDADSAIDLKDRLEANGHHSLFLDLDPEDGIRTGADWEQTLYRKLRQCQALIAMLSPNWLESQWCFAELVQAREQGKSIFPVKIAPCDTSSIFPDIQQIDLTGGREEGFQQLLQDLKAGGLDPYNVFTPDPERPPYPGLMAFQEADAAYFFGRSPEIFSGLETLNGLRRHGRSAARLVLCVGASGCGKSSLVRAGLIPRMKKMPDQWLPIPPFRPQEQPIEELAICLAELSGARGRSLDWKELSISLKAAADGLNGDGTTLPAIARDLLISSGHRDATVLLTVDQAEELFAAGAAAACGQFLRLLRLSLEAAGRQLMVLFTMRSDFLGEFQLNPALHNLADDKKLAYDVIPIDPISLNSIPEIIEGPARLAGIQLENGLVEAMVRETGSRDSLPLLAFTLRRLYERHREAGRILVQDYRALGGLEGAIRLEAERVIASASPSPESLDALRAAFVPTMVRINSEGVFTRCRAFWKDIPSQAEPLLRQFVEARLLVADRDNTGRDTVEVTHEALLRTWPKLKGWLDEDQDKLRLLETVRLSAQEWEAAERRPDLLVHRDGRLSEVETLFGEPRFALPEDSAEKAYVEACILDQHARERAGRRRTRLVIGSLALGLVVLAIFLGWAVRERNSAEVARELAVVREKEAIDAAEKAEKQRGVALKGLARFLATKSTEALNKDSNSSLLLAVEAVRATRDVDGSITPWAEQALNRSLETVGGMPLAVDTGGVAGVAFSPDGRWVSVADSRGIIKIWDLNAPETLPRLMDAQNQKVTKIAFSPNGEWLAVSGREPAVLEVWRLTRPVEKIRLIEGFRDGFQSVAFSPDGRWLMAAGAQDEAVIRLWPVENFLSDPILLTGHQIHRSYDGIKTGVSHAEFSPDGRWLFSTGWDKTARLWDLSHLPVESTVLSEFVGFSARPHFSPGGNWIASALKNRGVLQQGPVSVWRLNKNGSVPVTIDKKFVSKGNFSDDAILGFHPDALWLATLADRHVLLWDLKSPYADPVKIPAELAAVSKDGQWIAVVVKQDRATPRYVIELWDTGDLSRRAQKIGTYESSFDRIAFDPKAKRLLAVEESGRMLLWDIDRPQEDPMEMRGHNQGVAESWFSPDGRWLLSMGKWPRNPCLWRTSNPTIFPVKVGGVRRSADLKNKTMNGSSRGEPHGGLPDALSFSSSNRLAAIPGSSGDAMILRLDDPTASPMLLSGLGQEVAAVAFSPNGNLLAAAGSNYSARIWSLEDTDRPAVELNMPESNAFSDVSAMDLSPDGRWLVLGGAYGTVALWDTRHPNLKPRMLDGHNRWVLSAAFNSAGTKLLTAGDDGVAILRDMGDLDKEPVRLSGHRSAIRALFSRDDRWVITAGYDSTMRLWSTEDATADPRLLRGHKDVVSSMQISRGGRWLVSGSTDGTVRIWDLDSADFRSRLLVASSGNPLPINTVAIDGSDKWVAAGDIFGNVYLWRLDDPDRGALHLVAAQEKEDDRKRPSVWALGFSPDSRWLVALVPGGARLWRMRIEEKMDLACNVAGRNLSLGHWESYMGDTPYRLTCGRWGVHDSLLKTAVREAEKGEVERSVYLFERAAELTPELAGPEPRTRAVELAVAACLKRGRRLARKGRTEAALSELSNVLRIDVGRRFDPEAEIGRVAAAKKHIKEGTQAAISGDLTAAAVAYRQALGLDPGLDIAPEKEAQKEYAPILKSEGKKVAAKGRIAEAVEKLDLACAYGDCTRKDPEQEALSIWGAEIRREGIKLAMEGKLKPAIEKFEEALSVNPKSGIDPAVEAREYFAVFHVNNGDQLLLDGKYPEAADSYRTAVELNTEVAIPAEKLNLLCWEGSKQGHAQKVLSACDRAVELKGENGAIRDSRGVARALTGNIEGAIEDFRAYIVWAPGAGRDEGDMDTRRRWIGALESGMIPQNFEELQSLGAPE